MDTYFPKMNRFSKLLLLLLAVSLLSAGCSGRTGGKTTAASGTGPAAGASAQGQQSFPTDPTVPTGKPVAIQYSVPKLAAPPVEKRTAVCATKYVPPGDEIPSDSRSFIVAQVDPNRSFGPKCSGLKPGEECWIPLFGGWRLTESTEGTVVVQVFENDESKPASSPEVGPVPRGGRFNNTSSVHYIVGAKASKITLRAVLKDAAGRVVAQSIPQTVTVPTC